jgi:hypothetical protein
VSREIARPWKIDFHAEKIRSFCALALVVKNNAQRLDDEEEDDDDNQQGKRCRSAQPANPSVVPFYCELNRQIYSCDECKELPAGWPVGACRNYRRRADYFRVIAICRRLLSRTNQPACA